MSPRVSPTPSDQAAVSPGPPCVVGSSDPAQWFKDEVQPHDSQLRAYLRNAFPSVRDVDDVVQESYLRLWKTATREKVRSAKAFLYLVSRRVAINFIRKARNSPIDPYGDQAALGVLDDKPDALEATILRERIDLLADALMALPPRCRQVTILHKVKGYTQREVADQLGISERTVEVQIHTGVTRCLAYLRSHGLKNLRGDEA